MITTEYVVGTLATVSVAGVLVALGTDDWLLDLLWDVISNALRPGALLDQLRQLHQLPWPGIR